MYKLKSHRILFSALITLILSFLILTACTKKYDEEDVRKYIREEMHISTFKILSGPVDVKGEDSYTDQEWTISTDEFGLEDDFVFHVYNDYYYSLEWTSNRLDNDLFYRKQLFLLDTFDLPEGVSTEEAKDGSGRAWSVNFVCPLTSRADFIKAASAAARIQTALSSAPAFQDTEFSFSLKIGVSDPVTDACIDGRQYSFSFDSLTPPSEISDKISALSDNYLMDCIEKGLLDRMDEYTIPERSRVINESDDNTEIRRIDQNSAAYPGYAYNYYYDIPYGTLYRILEQEGYELNGDWKAFSFTGSDGQIHSFAYGDNKNVVSVDDINAMTGLDLDDGAELLEVAADKYLLEMFDTDAETFASELQALDGNFFREVRVSNGQVLIRGKGRQFANLTRKIEARLNALQEELRKYNAGYSFSFNNMTMVYQGLRIRLGPDVPMETARQVIDEAAALTAFSQILDQGRIYDWSLEVTFATWKEGTSEEVYSCTLPQDRIDYEKAFKALK